MQLFIFFVLLFASARSSKVETERDLLSSLDDFAFGYSRQASQYWDCPQVSSRVGKAEENRIWREAIPDARIEEKNLAREGRIVLKTVVYEWKKVRVRGSSSTMAKGDSSVQSAVSLSLRKPNFDGCACAMTVRMLFSRSKHINKRALLAMLPQLEQVKSKILEQMATYQVYPFIPKMAPTAPGPLVKRCLQMPEAENYHPRAFKHPYFTTADLVAWMAITARSSQKDQEEIRKLFRAMVHAFLPGFTVKAETVPTSSAGNSAKAVYVCHSFQYIPAGADHAFYFDGNFGKFLSLERDSIMLNRPEGIVDDRQHDAAVIFSDASVKASSLVMHQTKAEIASRRGFCELLENAVVLRVPAEATEAEVQACGVSTIRNLASQL